MVKIPAHLKGTAYHEAGHAVAALLLGRRFKAISIEPDGDILGLVSGIAWPRAFRPDTDDIDSRARSNIEKRIMIAAAGEGAESLYTGRRVMHYACQDAMQAVDLASYVCPENEECSAYTNWLWLRAKNLIREPRSWIMVEALASKLLNLPAGKRWLNYRQAVEAMRAS